MKHKYKKDQLSFTSFHVWYRYKAASQQLLDSWKEKRMTGFRFSWRIEKLPPIQADWKEEVQTPKYKHPLLAEMVQFARQIRLHNMTTENVLENIVHKKFQNIRNLDEDGMCSMEQIKPDNQKEAFLKAVTNVNISRAGELTSDEDIKTGYELFQAIVHCHTMVFKVFRFVDQLLSNESSRTIIKTFENLFQTGAITDKTSFTLTKRFYDILASTLNLQYGNVLLATLTNQQRQAVIENDWPFFANNSDLVKRCLQESQCEGLQNWDIFQNLGNILLLLYENEVL